MCVCVCVCVFSDKQRKRYIKLYIYLNVAQSAGVVEYIECTSAVRTPPFTSVLFDAKQTHGDLLMMLELRECGVPLHFHRS